MTAETANDILDLISLACYEYRDVLTQLLQERNLDGYTPFMSAVVFKVRAVGSVNCVACH